MSSAMAGRSAALFPVVGALIGLLLGGLGLWLDRFLPAGPVAGLLIASAALLTGGLHLDGLMDTADGAYGGHSPEQRLEIMRDSRVGAFGIIAGSLALLATFACLSELTGHNRLLALVVATASSRWSMVIALAIFPSARVDGVGVTFQPGVTPAMSLFGTLFVVLLAFATRPFGVVAAAAALAIVVAWGYFLSRRLGGLTGDCYGAIAVLTETAVLFLAVAVIVP